MLVNRPPGRPSNVATFIPINQAKNIVNAAIYLSRLSSLYFPARRTKSPTGAPANPTISDARTLPIWKLNGRFQRSQTITAYAVPKPSADKADNAIVVVISSEFARNIGA